MCLLHSGGFLHECIIQYSVDSILGGIGASLVETCRFLERILISRAVLMLPCTETTTSANPQIQVSFQTEISCFL